ncbi:uncharacterized protein [Dendrobates tinctorius]|uniref:uncharacterized protein isoform X2 n=1 Tax=Dendrobates tinctorius TaxID=92724 RepID=UPI003CC990B7
MFLHELRVCLGRRRAEQCACAGATAEVRRRMASYGDGRRRTATPIGPDPRVLWVSSIFSVVPSLDANSSCVLFPPSGVLEPPPSVFCQDSCDPAPLRCQMSLRSPIFPSLHFSWLARGLNMESSKIQAIIDWPVPGNIKEVQRFIGFANFYRRFIWNFSEIVRPITLLTKNGKTFVWSSQAQEAFDRLKVCFTTVI